MNMSQQGSPSSGDTMEDFVKRVDEAAITRIVTYNNLDITAIPAAEKLSRLAYLFESQGIGTYQKTLKGNVRDKDEYAKEMREHFNKAYICWNALLSLVFDYENSPVSEVPAEKINKTVSAIQNEFVVPAIFLAFRLGLTGLLADRTAEVRLALKRLSFPKTNTQASWRDIVVEHILTTFIRLVRKADGWQDIYIALDSIKQLREFQKRYEADYLAQAEGENADEAAVELVGFYHLAQLVTLSGEYLRTGQGTLSKVSIKMDHHHDQALLAFESLRNTTLLHIVDLLWLGCKRLTQNAIWAHVVELGPATQKFIHALTSPDRHDPIIELWPSQQIALKQLLNIYPNAISVQIPTSGGKTLLAKFAIMQAYALRPDGVIAYIVPTRVLVNQITLELRSDFQGILQTEQAIPVFELDPTEERLLDTRPNILVTTPEKLDLLIRRDHPATKNMSLVVVDEAHNIGDAHRGSRLELLLGTIKRDRPGVRFILLSPFLPNGDELASWLGDERTIPPIYIDWKPNRKLVGTVSMVHHHKNWLLEFETQESALVKDIRPGLHMILGQGTNDRTIKGITRASVRALAGRGTILVLCYGRKTAIDRAVELAEDREQEPPCEEVEAVCRYLEAEAGRPLGLTTCLRKGVAYHHSGLSQEARWLIENLIRHGHVKVICGTTTLAQGVNFPIATVILERLMKGDTPLSYQDFWNIVGRAGRTHVDPLGIVAFPAPDKEKLEDFREFLTGEAKDVASQFADLVQRIDEIGNRFNRDLLYKFPELSSLLQFLAHALRVAKDNDIAEEVEELLRSSLIFHQVQSENRLSARRLVELCRTYLTRIQRQRGLVEIADKTGFATPTVASLIKQRTKNKALALPENWGPEQFFAKDFIALNVCMEALSSVPEIDLNEAVVPGGKQKVYTTEDISGILRDWVKGDTIAALAKRYAKGKNYDLEGDDQVINFASFLFSKLLVNASWGVGALETIYLAGHGTPPENTGYIPSMIFFGVQHKEAIWLRMTGVPRIVADGLAQLWQQSKKQEPHGYDDVRNWVNQLTDNHWKQVIPKGSQLTPADMRFICKEFVG